MPAQAHLAEVYGDGNRPKPKSAAGNRIMRDKNRIRAAVANNNAT